MWCQIKGGECNDCVFKCMLENKTTHNTYSMILCTHNSNQICGNLGYYCKDCHMKPITTTTTSIGWQTCPVCNGSGVSQQGGTYNTIPTCPTCNGKRIISTITGNPPQ